MFGEAVDFLFAEDAVPIDDHVEDTSFAFNQFRLGSGFFFDRVRQTDGCRFVVSLSAVGNRDLHAAGILLWFDGEMNRQTYFCFFFDWFSIRRFRPRV